MQQERDQTYDVVVGDVDAKKKLLEGLLHEHMSVCMLKYLCLPIMNQSSYFLFLGSMGPMSGDVVDSCQLLTCPRNEWLRAGRWISMLIPLPGAFGMKGNESCNTI